MRKKILPAYDYMESCVPGESRDQTQARAFAGELGLAAISISPPEAHLIRWITRFIQPRKIVEIGTLTGLSSLYFLQTLRVDGRLWTFEKSSLHAEFATRSLDPYIKAGQCEIVLGDALKKLPEIEAHGPFDVVFIDGNKAAYFEYWLWAKKNVRAGGLVLIDNVFLAGAVWGDLSTQRFSEKQIMNVKLMTADIFGDPGFEATFIPTNEGLLVATKM